MGPTDISLRGHRATRLIFLGIHPTQIRSANFWYLDFNRIEMLVVVFIAKMRY